MKNNERLTFNWVLINKISIGTAPFYLEDLTFLKSKGINSILSLCSMEEAKPPLEINSLFNFKRIVLPDHKTGKTPNSKEIENALTLLEQLDAKGPVFVHCFAAIERSPLICIAWLIKKKSLSLSSALDYMMEVHKRTNPLPEQLASIKFLDKKK